MLRYFKLTSYLRTSEIDPTSRSQIKSLVIKSKLNKSTLSFAMNSELTYFVRRETLKVVSFKNVLLLVQRLT